MKLAKPTAWIAGIVVAAFAVAFVLLASVKDQLTVHLLDWNKKAVSASVTVQETRLYPILGSMKFLPQWARASTRSNHVNAIDGMVKVRRVNGLGNETLFDHQGKDGAERVPHLSNRQNKWCRALSLAL
jgi:hypothetical protein